MSDASAAQPSPKEPGRLEESSESELILEPPPVPDTKAPVTINTQINVQQIPKTAWDRLSPDQVLELSKHILTSMDVIDSRHFEYAMKRAERDDHGKRLSVIVGS